MSNLFHLQATGQKAFDLGQAQRRALTPGGIKPSLSLPPCSEVPTNEKMRRKVQEETTARSRFLLAVIRDKTGLLQRRIRQLIDFAKLETGEWKRSREAVTLAPFLAEAITAFRTEAESRGLGFDATVGFPDDTKVLMDEDLMCRVLENLIYNAFRYAAVGCAVRVEAASTGGETCFTIRIPRTHDVY